MADDRPSELLLTYAELGDRFGINADAARFRAKRAKWPIVTGNDGRVRVRITPSSYPSARPSGRPMLGRATRICSPSYGDHMPSARPS